MSQYIVFLHNLRRKRSECDIFQGRNDVDLPIRVKTQQRLFRLANQKPKTTRNKNNIFGFRKNHGRYNKKKVNGSIFEV